MQTTHSNEHPVFGLQHPHTHTLAGKHTHTHTCRQFHNVTQAGTKVNYCNFRGKLFYALTAWGLNPHNDYRVCVGVWWCVFVRSCHTLILLSAAIFRLQLFLLLLHMSGCECIPSPRKIQRKISQRGRSFPGLIVSEDGWSPHRVTTKLDSVLLLKLYKLLA